MQLNIHIVSFSNSTFDWSRNYLSTSCDGKTHLASPTVFRHVQHQPSLNRFVWVESFFRQSGLKIVIVKVHSSSIFKACQKISHVRCRSSREKKKIKIDRALNGMNIENRHFYPISIRSLCFNRVAVNEHCRITFVFKLKIYQKINRRCFNFSVKSAMDAPYLRKAIRTNSV